MNASADQAARALTRRFLAEFPERAAGHIERMAEEDAALALGDQAVATLVPLWRRLAPNMAAALLRRLPAPQTKGLLSELAPNEAVRLLGLLDESGRNKCLDLLDPPVRRELERVMAYPEDCAGRLMDTRYTTFRESATVEYALDTLRRSRSKTARSLFLIDENNRLTSRVEIQDLAVARFAQTLQELAKPIVAAVPDVAPQSEVVDALERYKLADLPVVDLNGELVGVVYHATLLDALHKDATVDIQTMVGASKDERALSSPTFAVRKRLPWLQVNLLTAFLAAAVVGLFESTIAQFTALAVLLPVVAGQSGNAGAQALAVTMRGLALREISLRQWWQVMTKEVAVGFANGIAVAVTCGIGVYLWSGSFGLVLVIMASMVLAMMAAGFAGAVVPIVLTRLGQDPATASSIILTTVTDVAGFFSFLGIATILAFML